MGEKKFNREKFDEVLRLSQEEKLKVKQDLEVAKNRLVEVEEDLRLFHFMVDVQGKYNKVEEIEGYKELLEERMDLKRDILKYNIQLEQFD